MQLFTCQSKSHTSHCIAQNTTNIFPTQPPMKPTQPIPSIALTWVGSCQVGRLSGIIFSQVELSGQWLRDFPSSNAPSLGFSLSRKTCCNMAEVSPTTHQFSRCRAAMVTPSIASVQRMSAAFDFNQPVRQDNRDTNKAFTKSTNHATRASLLNVLRDNALKLANWLVEKSC